MKQPQAPRQGQKQQRRNGHAFHPIMGKGGVHEKSNKAKRQKARQLTQRQLREGPGRPDSTKSIDLAAIKKAA